MPRHQPLRVGTLKRLLLCGVMAVVATAIVWTPGCASKGTGTTLVVSVFSDLKIGTEIDEVDVVVADGELRYPFSLGSGSGRSSLPVRVALVPGSRTDQQFTVQAVGLLAGHTALSQSARISFVPGRPQELRLFLGRSCISIPACPTGFTCDKGSCVSQDTVGDRRSDGRPDAGADSAVDGPAEVGPSDVGSAGTAGGDGKETGGSSGQTGEGGASGSTGAAGRDAGSDTSGKGGASDGGAGADGSAGSGAAGNGGSGGTAAGGQSGSSGAAGAGGTGSGGTGGGAGTACGFTMPNPSSAGLPNPASYTDNHDGTITDNITGLIWQGTVDAAAAWLSHEQADAYCQDQGGGWRLPTRLEMVSLIDFTVAMPGPTINQTYFPNTPSEPFWTGSSFNGAGTWWEVYFISGLTYPVGGKTQIRCVRQPVQQCHAMHYQVIAGGLVYDWTTGLTWQQTDAGSRTWDDALSYCPTLGAGWRLPSLTELQTIVDESKADVAIDSGAFPNTPHEGFWTSSPLAGDSTSAWDVRFNTSGWTAWGDRTLHYRVRCVR